MDSEKQKRLEEAGWKVGDAADFLGMSQEERQELDARIELIESLSREERERLLSGSPKQQSGFRIVQPKIDRDFVVVGSLISSDDIDDLSKDMLDASLPSGILISAGWYPDSSLFYPQGCYRVTVSVGLGSIRMPFETHSVDAAKAYVELVARETIGCKCRACGSAELKGNDWSYRELKRYGCPREWECRVCGARYTRDSSNPFLVGDRKP